MSEVTRRTMLRGSLATGFAGAALPPWTRTGSAQLASMPLSAHDHATLDTLARNFMRDYDMPGLSVAIARHGHLAYAGGFGVADKRTGEPVTAGHLFRIASVSKPITSVGVFSLVEKGLLALTDKVFGSGGILESEFGTPKGRMADGMTVSHLLTHLGGGWSNHSQDPMDLQKQMTHRELIAWTLKNVPLENPPGTRFAYSNFGYAVLGRIVEKVSRQRYDDYVREAVLARCGITAMKIAGNTLSERASGEVVYHHRSWNPYTVNMTRNDATGGWLASAVDLVRFAVHVDGFQHPQNILQLPTIKTMTTPSNVNPRYAYGWTVLKGNWRHDGLLPGSTSTLVRTASGYCWAALTNSSGKNGNHGLDNLIWNMVRSVRHWTTGEPPRP